METLIKLGKAGVISLYAYKDTEEKYLGAELSDVTGIAYDPSGNEIVASTPITPDTDGKMSLTIPDTETEDVYRDARVEFTYTITADSEIKCENVYFAIGATEFNPPAHYDDLIKRDSSIVNRARTTDTKYSEERKAAIDEMYSTLKNAGHQPHFIINQDMLSEALINLWLAFIYSTMSTASPDFTDRAEMYRDKFYRNKISKLNLLENCGDTANSYEVKPTPRNQITILRGS